MTNITTLRDDAKWFIIIPLDKEASCHFGRGTNWCTTKPNQRKYEEYVGKGKILVYCFNKETDKKWSMVLSDFFHDEFGDELNRPIGQKEFEQQTGLNFSELETLVSYKKEEFEVARKELMSQHADLALDYALSIREPWPQGEKIIATDAQKSVTYAKDVLHGRFPEGEPTIATSAVWSYRYAEEVIKGRFPEGEPTIAKNPEFAYWYAKDIIGGRWEEGEDAIMNSNYANDYKRLITLRVVS